MQIFEYQRSKEFNRNQAIYVLYTIDGLAFEEIAAKFDLSPQEIKEAVETHKSYEQMITGGF